jgi:hypothetical protein
VLLAIPTATGVRAAIVPTDVPIANEIKHDARNIPGSKKDSGIKLSVSPTVESIAPMSFADCANAPANRNIHIISMMFVFPAPLENISIRFAMLPLVVIMEYTDAIRNATVMGTLEKLPRIIPAPI